jgi:hypothetical protein
VCFFVSAAVVEGTIFCAHAGLSPQLYDLDLVRKTNGVVIINVASVYAESHYSSVQLYFMVQITLLYGVKKLNGPRLWTERAQLSLLPRYFS